MPILDALLAFSLTMLVIASTVNILLTLLLRVSKLRSTQLQAMLEDYYDNHVGKVVEREVKRVGGKVNGDAVKEVNDLAAKHNLSDVLSEGELGKIESLGTDDFVERLKRSKLGHGLIEKLGDEADSVIKELGKNYEQVGKKFSASFRGRTKMWGTGVALVLAFAFNIDSVHLMDTYLKDATVRNNIVAQMDAIVASKQPAVDDSSPQVTTEQINQSIDSSSQQLSLLTDMGLPSSYQNFPYCQLEADKKSNCSAQRSSVLKWFFWLLGIILTGVLAGLGAPFWYDLVTNVAKVTQRSKQSSGK